MDTANVLAELVGRAMERDALDVDALYRAYAPMVLRRCRRLLKDEQLALDAMQDTFVQLLRHEKKLEQVAASSLLYRIATNGIRPPAEPAPA